MKYFVVKYSGPFGFIKPWTAVRDIETFSQQFLTPSIIEGIEKKLFPDLWNTNGIQRILGHRLSYDQITSQQEVIQTRGWNSKRKGTTVLFDRPKAVLNRGLLLNPVLHLAFSSNEEALIANRQHVCLCRNEDVLFPSQIIQTTQEQFDTNEEDFPGFELIFEENDKSFLVGYHRFTNEPMYGWLRMVGKPVGLA